MRSHKSSAKGRNEQVIRILKILCDLDRIRGCTIGQLAGRYGTVPKTIRRDFEVLEAIGFPPEAEMDGREKRWRIEVKDTKKTIEKLSALIDVSHYLALRLAMEPGASLKRTSPIYTSLEDLSDKLEKAIGPAQRAELAAIEAAFFVYDKRAYKKAQPDVLWPLIQAIRDKRLCRVTYRVPRDGAQDKTYQVLPLKLFAWDGAVYLMCWEPKRRYQMKLNLQRLRSLKLLQRKGSVPADFKPEALENAAFGLVVGDKVTTYRLRFHRDVAPYIRERTWHPSQKLKDLPNRDVELEFRCTASYEVDAWVQSWGDGVEVLAPASLRTRQRELGEWLVEKYRKSAIGS